MKYLKKNTLLNEESGFALLMAVLLLVLLTIVFLVALNSNRINIFITGNERLSTQAEFAAHGCASVEGRKIRALQADSISFPSSSGVECETDQPQLTFYSAAIPGFQTGMPNGYQLSQFNFNSTGKAPKSSHVQLQSLAQALKKGQ